MSQEPLKVQKGTNLANADLTGADLADRAQGWRIKGTPNQAGSSKLTSAGPTLARLET